MKKVYLGTQLKVQLNIVADNFDMLRDNYCLDIKKQNTDRIVLHLDEQDIVVNDGKCYMILDTSELGVGTFSIIVTAYIPDEDFEHCVRREVGRADLFTVQRAQ